MEGFRREKITLNKGELASLGIIPNLYRPATAGHASGLQQLHEHYPDLVWPEIQMRIAWSDAALMRQPVWAVDPGSAAARECWAVVERTAGVLDAIQA